MSRQSRDGDPPGGLAPSTPTYDEAPPTVESQVSPFHPRAVASLKPTTPGMPALLAPAPKVQVAVVVPVVVGTVEDLAGPTDPDGYPITMSGEGPAEPWIDAPPTEPGFVMPRPTPAVPPPDAPTFEISKSLEMDSVKALEMAAETKKAPRVRRAQHVPQAGPGAQAPTQVLPALKRKPEREGSDWPLVLGLVGLFVVIAVLVGAVVYGVVSSRPTPAPAPAAEP
jgi:hypothetical protein